MVSLSVNVNKLATLRNARGGDTPNLVEYTTKILDLGVKSITVHPRPDERHITFQDVLDLHRLLNARDLEFNIEGFPDDRYIEILSMTRPTQATLVPDAPDVITSNAGWDLSSKKNRLFLQERFRKIRDFSSRISLFVDVNTISDDDFAFLRDEKIHRIELYTEEFAKNYKNNNQDKEVENKYAACAQRALNFGLEINAGHDLNLDNLETLVKIIPGLKEVSIGHALFCEAILHSLPVTIHSYLSILNGNNLK